MMTPVDTATAPLKPMHIDQGEIADRFPWATVNAKVAAQLLGVDPATFNTWRYRGKGPMSLPKRRRSRERMYRLSAILVWLHSRAGTSVREEDIWRAYIREAGCGNYIETLNEEELLSFIKQISPKADLGPCECRHP